MIYRLIVGVLLVLVTGGVWAADTASVVVVSTPAQSPRVAGAVADEASLKGRVLARWQALIERNFDAAYQFETPAYRTVYTPHQFLVQYGAQVDWRMANVKDVHYDDDMVARVVVEVAYHFAEPGGGGKAQNLTQDIKEVWLYKDGQWWYQRD